MRTAGKYHSFADYQQARGSWNILCGTKYQQKPARRTVSLICGPENPKMLHSRSDQHENHHLPTQVSYGHTPARLEQSAQAGAQSVDIRDMMKHH
jgi:hypothetical protein